MEEGRCSSRRRSSEGLRLGGVETLSGCGDWRWSLISSRRERDSSVAGRLTLWSSSHSRMRFGGAVLLGLSSRSRAAASAANWALEGGGAPLAICGMPELAWCSYGVLGNPPPGDGAGLLTIGLISGRGLCWRLKGGTGVWLVGGGTPFGGGPPLWPNRGWPGAGACCWGWPGVPKPGCGGIVAAAD